MVKDRTQSQASLGMKLHTRSLLVVWQIEPGCVDDLFKRNCSAHINKMDFLKLDVESVFKLLLISPRAPERVVNV